MNIPKAAIEAAAKAAEHHAGIFQEGACPDHYHEDSWECVAGLILEAAAPFITAQVVAAQTQALAPIDEFHNPDRGADGKLECRQCGQLWPCMPTTIVSIIRKGHW